MGVYRRKERGNAWWFEFQQDGQRHRGACLGLDGAPARTRTDALAAEMRARERLKRAASPVEDRLTLARALALHARGAINAGASQSHVASLQRISFEMLQHFGEARTVVSIGAADVTAYTEFLRAQKRKVWAGGPRKIRQADYETPRLWRVTDRPRSVSEVNHCLDVLRCALQVAHNSRDPLTGHSLLPFPPEIPSVEEPDRDPTPMSDREYRARMAEAPPWVRDAAALAWWFGLRRSEVLRLELRHIDHENRCLRLLGSETKSGRDEPVFGGSKGWTLLRWLERQARRRGQTRLVTWPGKHYRAALAGRPIPPDCWQPLNSIRRSWKTTAGAAEIDHPRRFHDIRAAYITNIARHGSAKLTKGLARHSSMATTERYIALVDKEYADVAELAAKRRSTRSGRGG